MYSSRQSYTTSGSVTTAIDRRTHSRFTRQDSGYAQTRWFATKSLWSQVCCRQHFDPKRVLTRRGPAVNPCKSSGKRQSRCGNRGAAHGSDGSCIASPVLLYGHHWPPVNFRLGKNDAIDRGLDHHSGSASLRSGIAAHSSAMICLECNLNQTSNLMANRFFPPLSRSSVIFRRQSPKNRRLRRIASIFRDKFAVVSFDPPLARSYNSTCSVNPLAPRGFYPLEPGDRGKGEQASAEFYGACHRADAEHGSEGSDRAPTTG